MFKIESTSGVEMYIAASEISRIIDRDYSGGGSIICMRDGTRIETYKHIDAVYVLVGKDQQ